jgi:hypothetical protein
VVVLVGVLAVAVAVVVAVVAVAVVAVVAVVVVAAVVVAVVLVPTRRSQCCLGSRHLRQERGLQQPLLRRVGQTLPPW